MLKTFDRALRQAGDWGGGPERELEYVTGGVGLWARGARERQKSGDAWGRTKRWGG